MRILFIFISGLGSFREIRRARMRIGNQNKYNTFYLLFIFII